MDLGRHLTAGMDLALAMVAAYHGQPLALKVANRMVMVSKRSGGQSQFNRRFKTAFGVTPQKYVEHLRIAMRTHQPPRAAWHGCASRLADVYN